MLAHTESLYLYTNDDSVLLIRIGKSLVDLLQEIIREKVALLHQMGILTFKITVLGGG